MHLPRIDGRALQARGMEGDAGAEALGLAARAPVVDRDQDFSAALHQRRYPVDQLVGLGQLALGQLQQAIVKLCGHDVVDFGRIEQEGAGADTHRLLAAVRQGRREHRRRVRDHEQALFARVFRKLFSFLMIWW